MTLSLLYSETDFKISVFLLLHAGLTGEHQQAQMGITFLDICMTDFKL